MYPFGRNRTGVSKKTRDILLLAVALLLALNVLQLVLNHTGSASPVRTESVLTAQIHSDLDSARSIASQLVRTGGSNTTTHLSQVRQYLYGVSQAAELYEDLVGSCPVSRDTVQSAMDAVSSCENLMLSGASIGTPLNQLWSHLDELLSQSETLK